MTKTTQFNVTIAMVLIGLAVTAKADVLTFDANGLGAGVTDGSANWNGQTWYNSSTNVMWSDWSNSATTAAFGNNNGAAGTVTLMTTHTAGGIVFNAPGSGVYTLSGGTVALSSSAGITANVSATINSAINPLVNQTWTVADGAKLTVGRINNGSEIIKAGAGTLEINTNNQFNYTGTGSTRITGGTVRVTVDNALGLNKTVTFDGAGATMQYALDTLVSGSFVMTQQGTINVEGIKNVSLNTTMSGPGGFVKTGSGKLIFNAGGTAHTVGGVIEVTQGTMIQQASAGTASFLVNGGTLDRNTGAFSETINVMSGKLYGLNKSTGVLNVLNGGTFQMTITGTQNSRFFGTTNVLEGGTLTGHAGTETSGAYNGLSVDVLNVSGTLDPTHNGVDYFVAGDTTFASTGAYICDIGKASALAPPLDWDQLMLKGSLTVAAGATFKVSSMGVDPTGWDKDVSNAWMVGNVAQGHSITGLENFAIDATSLFTAAQNAGFPGG